MFDKGNNLPDSGRVSMQYCAALITYSAYFDIMAETWDDVTKDGTQPLKEWVVEYTVLVNRSTNHHLSIMYGEEIADVQRSLLHELRKSYGENERIDVTVQRMEEIQDTSEPIPFEGSFTP